MYRISINDCTALAMDSGIMCLSEKYINSKTKLKWKCTEGHVWSALYHNVKNGSRCPYCAGKIIDKCEPHDYAIEKGGECLSEYKNYKTKLKWKCHRGHEWYAGFGDIKLKNNWCPYCAGNARLSVADCVAAAKAHGGKCITDVYKNNSTLVEWQCKNGHFFESRLYNVRNMNNWCPYCYGNSKKTIQDMGLLARLNGGLCLSDSYKNNISKLKWQCENNHNWYATYSSVQRGAWCPECNNISNKQRKLGNIVREITKSSIVHNFRGFDWLRASDTGYKLEIDIWVPGLKLAIEYDGEHHFVARKFGSMSDKVAQCNLLRRQYLDSEKDKMINNSNEVNTFVRFNYMDAITREHVLCQFTEDELREFDK